VQTGQLLTGWGLNATEPPPTNNNGGNNRRRRPVNGGNYVSQSGGLNSGNRVAIGQTLSNQGTFGIGSNLDYNYDGGNEILLNQKASQGLRPIRRPGSGATQGIRKPSSGIAVDYNYDGGNEILLNQKVLQGLRPIRRPGSGVTQGIRKPSSGISSIAVDYNYDGEREILANQKVSQGLRPIRRPGSGLPQQIRQPSTNDFVKVPTNLLTADQLQVLLGNQQRPQNFQNNPSNQATVAPEELTTDENGGEDEDEDYANVDED